MSRKAPCVKEVMSMIKDKYKHKENHHKKKKDSKYHKTHKKSCKHHKEHTTIDPSKLPTPIILHTPGVQGPPGVQGLPGQTGPAGPSEVLINQTNFVDVTYGNDLTAVPNDEKKPFQTLLAANTNALARGTDLNPVVVYVQPGTYDSSATGLLLATRVRWYISENARIRNVAGAPIFLQSEDDVLTTISGQGVFLSTSGADVTPAGGVFSATKKTGKIGIYATPGGGILHMTGNNGKISLRGTAAVSTDGIAFLMGPGATATTGALNVMLAELEVENYAGFVNFGATNIQSSINNVIVRNAEVLALENSAGTFPLGAFATLQTQMITASSSPTYTGRGIIVNDSGRGGIVTVFSNIIDARLTVAPIICVAFPADATMGTVTLLNAPDIIVGGGAGVFEGTGGGLVRAVSAAPQPVGLGTQVIVDSLNIFGLGTQVSLVNIQGIVQTRVSSQFTVNFQDALSPYVVGENSMLVIAGQTVTTNAIGSGALLPFFTLGNNASLDVQADQGIDTQSTLVSAPTVGSNGRISIVSPNVNINTNRNGQISEPAIVAMNSSTVLDVDRFNVTVDSASQNASYALLDFQGNEVHITSASLNIFFNTGQATTAGNTVEIIRVGTSGVNNTTTTFAVAQMNYNGTNTIGIHVNEFSSVFGRISDYSCFSSSQTNMLLVEGNVTLVISAINLGDPFASNTSSCLSVAGLNGILRINGNALTANGAATGLSISERSSAYVILGEMSTSTGPCVRMNANVENNGIFLQLNATRLTTQGSPSPTVGEFCIGATGVTGASFSADFVLGDVETGSCIRGINFDLPTGFGDVRMRCNSLQVNNSGSYGVQAGLYWDNPGHLTATIPTARANSLLLPSEGGIGSAAMFHLRSGVVTIAGSTMTLDQDAAHGDQPAYAPMFLADSTLNQLLIDVGTVRAPGRVGQFTQPDGAIVTFRSERAETTGAGTSGGNQTTPIDAVIFISPGGGGAQTTYSGLLRNLTPDDGSTMGSVIVVGSTAGSTVGSVIRERGSTLVSNGPCITAGTAVQTIICEQSISRTPPEANIVIIPPGALVDDPAVQ